MTDKQLKVEIKDTLLSLKTYEKVQERVNSIMMGLYYNANAKTFEHYGVENLQELQIYDSKIIEFDCGWLLWEFKDKDLQKHIKELKFKQYGYSSSEIRLYSPVAVQSTSIQAYNANIIKETLDAVLPMSFRIHLD